MKVGIAGTGLMGQPMAMRLIEAGYEVVAYNRTREKLQPLKEAGAIVAETTRELVEMSGCIIFMLADAAAIEGVLVSGNAMEQISGRTAIQMSTIAPSESKALARGISDRGGYYLEAPVLGSVPQAKSGQLQVMVGASEALFEQWHPLLQHFGEPLYIGEVGTAAATKLALNQLIASLTSAFALSLSFVQRQGVEVDKFMKILRESALYAPTFDKKLQRMVERDFSNPNFPSKHLLKDVNLFLNEALATQLNVSALQGVRTAIETAVRGDYPDADYSALYAAINRAEEG